MARRKPDGSYAQSKAARVQGKGDKAITVMGDKHGRDAQIRPDETAVTETELHKSEVVVDTRRVHDVMIGQRRVVVLPADLCRRLGISEGTPLRLVEHGSHFEVIPMRLVPAAEVTSDTLESLVAGVTPENLHGEFDTGPPVGQEAW